MRDQTDSRTLPLPLHPGSKPPGCDRWFPFVVHYGERLIGVYWGPDAKFAASSARMESRSFGPVDLTGKRLVVELHAAGRLA